MQHKRGFTLLEVLIALVVLSLALFALTRTAGGEVNAFGALRDRTLAAWVAADILAQTRLSESFPQPGRRSGQIKYANRDWHWELVVQATDVTSIRRLDVRVFSAQETTAALVQLSGFSGEDLQR